ncbi:MAG: NAD(P)H-binding protein [Gemmatimonadota bacterium]
MASTIRRLVRFDDRRALPFALAAALVLAACGGGSDAPEGEAPAQTEAPAAQDGDMIIVSGASGQLGEMVVEALLERGVPASRLILVSRTPDELEQYASMGASTRFGDFTQPESLPAAYEGGDRMLLISINTGVGENRAQLHKNAIDAAVAAGVQHIAYTSLINAPDNDSPLAADHKATEQFLMDSGVAWTMLRNSLYMDPLLTRAMDMIVDGRVERSEYGASYVTRYDCADAAAAVLTTDGHDNQAYDITGPAVVRPQDIATALTEVTGLSVRVVDADSPSDGGLLSDPSYQIVSDAVQQLTGHAPTSVEEFFEFNHDDIMAGTGA